MKKKKSTALFLALLMIATVFLNGTSVFAEDEQEVPGVNQVVEKVQEVKLEDKKDNLEEVKAKEEEKDSEKTEAKEELKKDEGLEISKEEVPEVVGEPEQYDINKLKMIAKVVKNGATEYYGVKTYNNQKDHLEKEFYKISKEVYDEVAKDSLMRFARVELGKDANGNETKAELPFKLRMAKLGGDINDPNASFKPEEEAVFTEVYLRHHMAYEEGFVVNNAPHLVEGQGAYTYLIDLKKDWIVDESGFTPDNKNNWILIDYNCILEGNGKTIKRTNDNPKYQIVEIGAEQRPREDNPNPEVTIRDLTIDGTNKFVGIQVNEKRKLNLENVKVKNGKGTQYEGGGISVHDFATLNMDKDCEVSNCTSPFVGVVAVDDAKAININGSKFLNNFSQVGGGVIGILGKECNVNINNAIFENNISDGPGGAIYSNSSMAIDNTIFKNNSSKKKGGAIYQAKEKELNITNSNFEENSSELDGGAVFVNYKVKAKIESTNFIKNNSNKNGGGVSFEYENKNESIVSKCSFEDNSSIKGGGIFVGKISKLKVEEAKFKNNSAEHGGAIYTDAYEYADPISKKEAYKNLTVDEKTLFIENKADAGLFSPPSNYTDFANLKFNPKSDVDHGVLSRKSLLNNYDVNYKNPNKLIIYDANGGQFSDGSKIKSYTYPVGDKIKIMKAPTREGYRFLYWKGSEYKPGDSYTVKDNHTFLAQWKADPKSPKPDEPKKPHDGGKSYFMFIPADRPLLNLKDHAQYMIGYKDQTFRPDNQITRQEVAAMFSRLLNERPQKGMIYSRDYKDIPDDLWSATAISYMSKLGLVKGYPDGNFRPFANISRAEFAAMATRFAQLTGGSKTFTDVPKDHWAYESIQRAAEAGWVSGYPDGSFKPDQPISRAEVVAITNRMLNRFADEEYVNHNPKEIIPYKDMEKTHWAYYPIVEAANGHSYERKANGQDERWFEVNNTSFVYDK